MQMQKIRPFADKTRNGCLSLDRRSAVAVDEQMMQQLARGKRDPVGLKNFICDTSGGASFGF